MAAWRNSGTHDEPCCAVGRQPYAPPVDASSKHWKITERRKHPMPENKKKTRGNLAVMAASGGAGASRWPPVMVAGRAAGRGRLPLRHFYHRAGRLRAAGQHPARHAHQPWAPFACCCRCCAIARGVLHYAEQGCNHFIAFKLLALIRDKVFARAAAAGPGQTGGPRPAAT